VNAAAVLLPSLLLMARAAVTRPHEEGPAARTEARACLEGEDEKSLEACRNALALGLRPEREAAVRQIIVLRLAAQQRWDDVVDTYRDEGARRPDDGEVHRRLGLVLLLALDRPLEAEAPLREAVRLQPHDAEAWLGMALALGAQGRGAEALAAFEAARTRDAGVLEDRPAAAAVYEAVKRGERWP
jgi:tetratricopeptide (TPR) repeat protein